MKIDPTETHASDAKSLPEYWGARWEQTTIPDPIDPNSMRSQDILFRVFHQNLLEVLSQSNTEGSRKKLIELGCGGSRWLPYFASNFNLDVSGLDYSESGCQLAKAILDKANISGHVIKGDLFNPTDEFVGRFDIAASFGLIEHFEDTAGCLKRCAAFLREDGLLITYIPNFAGLYGWLYRIFRPKVYRLHVPLTLTDLVKAHRAAGLEVVGAHYLLGSLGVMDESLPGFSSVGLTVRRLFGAISRLIWFLEGKGIGLPPNAITSPYLFCFARKVKQQG